VVERAHRGGTLKHVLRRGVLIALGFGLFLLFLYRLDLSVLKVSIREIRLTPLCAIVLLNFAVPLLKTVRWQMLLSRLGMSVGKMEMFQGVSAGYFLGLVTPGTSGEVGRIFTVELNRSMGVTTVLYEKFFDFLVLFLISGCALLFHYSGWQVFVLALVLCGGVSVLGLYLSSRTSGRSGRILAWMLRRVIRGEKRASIETVSRSLNRLSGDFRLSLVCVLFSLVLWILPGVQFYLICKSLSIPIDFQMTMIGFYVPYLAGVVSLLPLGLGVFDFSTKGILSSSYGLGPELASSVALVFRILVTLPLVVWGFIWYCYRVWRRQR
jgi:uncharacterized protein (TIRG00374 family)